MLKHITINANDNGKRLERVNENKKIVHTFLALKPT